MRGYWGLVFYEPKTKSNIGTAIRSAHCFGANFLGIIGKRYHKHPADTMATHRHIPLVEYSDLEDFKRHVPVGCKVVAVEVDGQDLSNFVHPERAVYLMGGEDRNVPAEFTTRIKIPTKYCLNMSVAASIIMFDRQMKRSQVRGN